MRYKKDIDAQHRELVSQGWVRRFSAEGSRLEEMNEYYQSLGFETLVVDGALGEDGACRTCFDLPGFEERYKTLYTRERNTRHSCEDEMF